jgi:tetratricopeptide (TPR) repeat protein
MFHLRTIRKIPPLFLLLFLLQQIYPQPQAFDSLANEINRISLFQKTQSLEMLEHLYQMAYNSKDSSLLITYCLYEESSLNFRQGIVDSLLTNKIKQRLENKHLTQLEHALLQSALGINLTSEGEYADAFPLQLQSLETFKQIKHNPLIAKTLNALGNICRFINLLGLAEYYHSEAIAYITPNTSEYYITKANIYRIKSLTKPDDDAVVDSLLFLLEIAEKENRKELLPLLNFNIGAHYYETEPEKSLPFFMKILSMDIDNPKSTAALYGNLGSYYSSKEDYEKALHYFKDTQKIMENNNDFYNLSILYNELAFIYEQQNRYDSAFYYTKKNRNLMLRTRSHLVAIETYQKYINTFLEAQKNELIIAEQAIKLKSKQFIIIVVAASSAVLLILLFLLLVNQQKRRKISENLALTAKLEHEEKVQQYEKKQRKLEKEKQEEMLDAKTREITSYSILVSNKNQLLKQISGLNTQILDNKENAIKMATKIDEIIQSNINIDEEWENFKIHFDKVHPHFFEKLKQLCDDLTEENLRFCAYIKIGMTTKQIAQLLHVIPSTIFTSRYRLKKKLQLSDEEDVDDFIWRL